MTETKNCCAQDALEKAKADVETWAQRNGELHVVAQLLMDELIRAGGDMTVVYKANQMLSNAPQRVPGRTPHTALHARDIYLRNDGQWRYRDQLVASGWPGVDCTLVPYGTAAHDALYNRRREALVAQASTAIEAELQTLSEADAKRVLNHVVNQLICAFNNRTAAESHVEDALVRRIETHKVNDALRVIYDDTGEDEFAAVIQGMLNLELLVGWRGHALAFRPTA